MLHGITGIAQPLSDVAGSVRIIFHQQYLQSLRSSKLPLNTGARS
jgi:hypothetical protein